MKFFDRSSDIVVSTNRIEESVSKQDFQAEVDGDEVIIYGQASGVQRYSFAEVLQPVDPDIASLVLTLNHWSQLTRGQKMATVFREAIPNPTEGIEVYDTDLEIPMFFDGVKWRSMSADSGKCFAIAMAAAL